MDLSIAAFEVMAEIAKENRIKSVKWAAASGLSPSRVSDFKRLAKQARAEAAEPNEERQVGGHIFSINNFLTLWDGLKRLVGPTALRKGLMNQLETKSVSARVRIFLRLMTFNIGQLKLVDAFTDALLLWVNLTSARQNDT